MVRDQTSYGFAFRRGRAAVEIPIDFETYGDSFVATAINIGLGGLFVASDRRFETGDQFKLRFTLPDQPVAITVGAEVRWLHRDQGRVLGMGLRFVRLPIAGAVAIQEFLRNSDDDLTPAEPSS
jgi:uncharacterized protein (TIGR02266 family)